MKFNVGALVCVERDKKWNKGHYVLTARPHPANPTICEMKMHEELKEAYAAEESTNKPIKSCECS